MDLCCLLMKPTGKEIKLLTNILDTAEKVVDWARARNLLEGTNAQRQFLKVVEEAGEIDTALVAIMRKQMEAQQTGGTVDANVEIDELKDAFGDTLVTVIILAEQYGLSSKTIIQNAQDLGNINQPVNSILSGLGNIASTIARSKPVEEIEQVLTDFVYTVIRYAGEFNLFTIEDALEAAYNVIKDRRGVMRNGVFIKEEDLNEGEVAV